MKLEPLSDFVFLTYEKQKKTSKGVLLSDVSKNKPATAKVISVGPGRLDRHGNFVNMSLKKGDIIAIDPFLPREVNIEGKDYLVMRESEVFCVINKK